MMLSSLLATIEDFFVTGFVSLAIVLATLRAQFDRLSASFEWPSFLGAFIVCLTLTLGLYLYISVARYLSIRRTNNEEDEWEALRDLEEATGRRFHVLPVILAWGQHDGEAHSGESYPSLPRGNKIIKIDGAELDTRGMFVLLLQYRAFLDLDIPQRYRQGITGLSP